MSADDAEWLEDFLLEVFKSPSWEAPIMMFIDTHAGAFWDAAGGENKLEYTVIHKAFTELVEGLLEEHLAEVGISAEQFLGVVMDAKANKQFQALVTEQILAMDDFLSFKKLMVRRHAELEVEALSAAWPRGDGTARSLSPMPAALTESGGGGGGSGAVRSPALRPSAPVPGDDLHPLSSISRTPRGGAADAVAPLPRPAAPGAPAATDLDDDDAALRVRWSAIAQADGSRPIPPTLTPLPTPCRRHWRRR